MVVSPRDASEGKKLDHARRFSDGRIDKSDVAIRVEFDVRGKGFERRLGRPRRRLHGHRFRRGSRRARRRNQRCRQYPKRCLRSEEILRYNCNLKDYVQRA